MRDGEMIEINIGREIEEIGVDPMKGLRDMIGRGGREVTRIKRGISVKFSIFQMIKKVEDVSIGQKEGDIQVNLQR